MAILSTSNLISEQRYDISDARRIESAVRNDFDTTVTSIITNTSQGYIIRGFSLLTSGAIGSAANGLQMMVDPGAVLNINASVSGTIFQTPIGTPNQILNAATNTNVSGSFAANSTNYVGIDYLRFADPTTDVTKYIWNSAANDEIPEIAPAAQTLTFEIFITTSVWAENVLPVAIVTTDSNGNVTSITDARWMLYSLETGGLDPNPNYTYPWTEGRTQPPVTTTSDSVDPFIGGDKQIDSLKAWMDAVMSTFLEVKGSPYWFTGPSVGPIPTPTPSLISIFQDLGNTVVTGSGEISNGILPNSDPILVTTGNITGSPTPSNQLTSLASTSGLANGDYIIGTGIPQGTTIANISGSTVTMSANATLNGTGITVTFFSPSVITAPGQINWDMPISIRVIGSSLTYTLAANPSSTDITLADDQVAYITLVRDVKITPNLIFTTGSPTINSVGAVSWTSGLLAGDYVKVASDTSSGYYEIYSVNSPSQVTLTSNVVLADNTGATGAAAEYAFGSYLAAATPTTTRNIYIAARDAVPMNGNTFWLFLREDNGGSPRVYVRFLGMELDNGESVNVSGTTSLELLQYIGSSSASDAFPQYVDALNPGSIAQVTNITTGAGSTVTGGQYFLIYSSANARQYAAWFKVSGVGSAPVVANTNDAIEIDILSSDSATTVASEVAAALNSTPYGDFKAVATGAAVVATNASAGVANNAVNISVGAPFAVSTSQTGTGTGNYVIQDGQNLTLAIKELDQGIGNIEAILDSPTYDEVVEIVASGATPPTSLNGPVANGTNITLPNNTRITGTPAQYYTVGKGTLQVFLNGQFMDIESGAYSEVGTAGTPSNQIEILTLPGGGLVVGDELEFRLNGVGGGAGGGGVGPAGPPGAAGPRGFDALQGPVSISTKTGPVSYNVLSTDCFLRANCAGGVVTFNLPAASTVTGDAFYFKKVDASSVYMNVVAAGSDTIDGFGTISTNVQYESFSIISNGSTWDIF
jgi:hypothetical protein